jgi:hypothetical protein
MKNLILAALAAFALQSCSTEGPQTARFTASVIDHVGNDFHVLHKREILLIKTNTAAYPCRNFAPCIGAFVLVTGHPVNDSVIQMVRVKPVGGDVYYDCQ